MARPLRIEYPGALYHITSRGNKRQEIFRTDDDREDFLNVLLNTVRTHNWICHAYCLMDNHYHLLIETLDANLSVGMRDLNGIYTQRYNKTHKTVGHIFQGRYHTYLIETDPYLLQVARYVVLNPVRAGIVSDPAEWKWSSYLGTSGQATPHACLSLKFLLSLFSDRLPAAHKQYCSFVNEGVEDPSPFVDVKHKTILGSPQFISDLWEENYDAEEIKEISKSERMINRLSLQELFDDDITRNDRDDAIFLARLRCGYSVSDIATHLKLHRSTVSKILNQKMKT